MTPVIVSILGKSGRKGTKDTSTRACSLTYGQVNNVMKRQDASNPDAAMPFHAILAAFLDFLTFIYELSTEVDPYFKKLVGAARSNRFFIPVSIMTSGSGGKQVDYKCGHVKRWEE